MPLKNELEQGRICSVCGNSGYVQTRIKHLDFKVTACLKCRRSEVMRIDDYLWSAFVVVRPKEYCCKEDNTAYGRMPLPWVVIGAEHHQHVDSVADTARVYSIVILDRYFLGAIEVKISLSSKWPKGCFTEVTQYTEDDPRIFPDDRLTPQVINEVLVQFANELGQLFTDNPAVTTEYVAKLYSNFLIDRLAPENDTELQEFSRDIGIHLLDDDTPRVTDPKHPEFDGAQLGYLTINPESTARYHIAVGLAAKNSCDTVTAFDLAIKNKAKVVVYAHTTGALNLLFLSAGYSPVPSATNVDLEFMEGLLSHLLPDNGSAHQMSIKLLVAEDSGWVVEVNWTDRRGDKITITEPVPAPTTVPLVVSYAKTALRKARAAIRKEKQCAKRKKKKLGKKHAKSAK